MNLPNKLTVFRVFLIPFFLLSLYMIPSPWGEYIGVAVFLIASLTDLLDGWIARKYNLVTNFGKFMDPLADKMLVGAALIYLTEVHIMPAWATIVIISREFIISGFRLVAAEKGQVISAGIWGKIKTAVTMVAIPVFLLPLEQEWIPTMRIILTLLVVMLTVFSAVDYLVKNKDALKDE